MKLFISVLVYVVVATGCYTGRTASAKRANYAINGVIAFVGTALLVSSANDGGSCTSDDASCVGGAMGAGGGAAMGLLLVGGGLLGIGITAVVPTKEPEPSAE